MVKDTIPAGTEGEFQLLLNVSSDRYEETDVARIFEFGQEKDYIEIPIPKEGNL